MNCNFCGRGKEEVGMLIGSSTNEDVFICRSCIQYVKKVKDSSLTKEDRKTFRPPDDQRID